MEMEEKTHDEGEESWQLALKHPRWQENEASLPDEASEDTEGEGAYW